jgi:hypothetical protein
MLKTYRITRPAVETQGKGMARGIRNVAVVIARRMIRPLVPALQKATMIKPSANRFIQGM